MLLKYALDARRQSASPQGPPTRAPDALADEVRAASLLSAASPIEEGGSPMDVASSFGDDDDDAFFSPPVGDEAFRSPLVGDETTVILTAGPSQRFGSSAATPIVLVSTSPPPEASPPQTGDVDRVQQKALDTILAGKSVYIAGKPGELTFSPPRRTLPQLC
jgi:hypothetical protein